jgi:hypothetical protein
MFHFSLGQSVMNAPAQSLSYRNRPWCNGVNKTPPFIHFRIGKGKTRTIEHWPIVEGLSFQSLDRHIYYGKLRNEKDYPSVQGIFTANI